MLDSPPKETEKLSWIYLGLGVLVVYATIPLARGLRDTVAANIGREFFLYLTLILTLGAAWLAVASLRRRRQTPGAYACLGLVLVVFLAFIYQLREIPEEAIHVAEYGVLGLLVFRALTHRVRDFSIYLLASLVIGMVGIVDEYIQWVVPARFYEVRDILINFAAGVLSQIAIATGLRPRLITGWPARAGWRRVCFYGAAALTLLAVGLVNTPARVTWYANQVQALEFLLYSKTMTAEYGFLHQTPATGRFRSRFTLEDLTELDRERGVEVARVLDRYIRGEGYDLFLSNYSVLLDPYAHEAGVHLFRREYHLDRAKDKIRGREQHYRIAYYENQILKRHYTNAIVNSIHRWDAATEAEVDALGPSLDEYESPVSASLITRLSETQMLLSFAFGIILLLLIGALLGRAKRGEDKV